MPELKPCPFCGGEAEIVSGSVFIYKAVKVKCKRCVACTDLVFIDLPAMSPATGKPKEETRYTKEEAVEIAAFKWNRRVPIMSELDQRLYDSLQAENKELKKRVDELTAKLVDTELKCGDLVEMNAELRRENHVLNAQMEVVRMFLGKGDCRC